jgi:replicative DNA helicase
VKILRAHGADMTEHPQLVRGADYILKAPDHVPAIFGQGRDVLWAQGEGLLIVGPQGVGKTTILQQLALRRAGVLQGDLIGYSVAADTERLTLYLALDRPQQIARSFKRMVSDDQALLLAGLVIWKGPLPFSVVKEPEKLLAFVQDIGEIAKRPVGTVCADSIKDIAAPLSSDEVGSALNRAVGGLISAEIEFAASHHQRKATSENKKPRSLDDVYGSTWLTAGMGSVLLAWGEPGDPIIELTHLKQPAEEVGPLDLVHDHEHGVTTRRDRLDAWAILQGATTTGVTVADAAQALYGINVSKAQIEKARRKLERFVTDGDAVKIKGKQPTDSTLYRPVSVSARDSHRERTTERSRSLTNGSTEPHAPHTGDHDATVTVHHPLKGGGRDRNVSTDESAPDGLPDEYLQGLIDQAEVA